MAHLKSTSGEPIHLWLLEEPELNSENVSEVDLNLPKHKRKLSEIDVCRKNQFCCFNFFAWNSRLYGLYLYFQNADVVSNEECDLMKPLIDPLSDKNSTRLNSGM